MGSLVVKMAPMDKSRARVYGGRSADARRAERRHKLIDAALEIWQDQGWAAVTMRGVCARAGVIDRYFYESFPDRDALLGAVWDQVRDGTLKLLLDSVADKLDQPPLTQLRAAIAAYVRHLAEDPRRAQIFFGEHAGSVVLEKRRHATLQTATDLLCDFARPHLAPGVDENAFRMTTLMGIGGFSELIAAWHAGIVKADADQIIDHASEFGDTLAAQYLPK